MITITFDMNDYSVIFSGHAESKVRDDENHDMVCACASILFYTLHDNICQFTEWMEKGSVKTSINKGDAMVSCKPAKKYEQNVTLMYLFAYNGLKLLADDYPDNLTVILK